MRITKKHVERLKIARQKAADIEVQIHQRIDEIFSLIFKAHRVKRPKSFRWWFYGAEAGEYGTSNYDKYLNFETTGIPNKIFEINPGYVEVSLAGCEIFNSWPEYFLFATDKQILDIIQKEIKNIKEEEKKAKNEFKKEEKIKKKLREKAFYKLTPDERAALGGNVAGLS